MHMLSNILEMPLRVTRTREIQQHDDWIKLARIWYAGVRKCDRRNQQTYTDEEANDISAKTVLRELQRTIDKATEEGSGSSPWSLPSEMRHTFLIESSLRTGSTN